MLLKDKRFLTAAGLLIAAIVASAFGYELSEDFRAGMHIWVEIMEQMLGSLTL